GLSCWCVDENGIEVPGSKQNGYPISCLSFCQLQKQRVLVSGYINSSSISYIPQCLDSGAFDVVQCDVELGQCWCVDQEGMEIYGTRQRGKPTQCPGTCEIRDRRILHGVGEKSPPQCSEDGEFLPVQCKFVNTTDMMVFELIHNYNRLPVAFQTFSSFRETFPEVSGYCYCVDSLGRELADTGLELLLDEVYDTIFSALEPARTFTETSMYRILQRRFLGVQLATSGRFRCPSKCEVERYAAQRYQHAYIPSCDTDGGYTAVQCQQGGQCWCVDTKGQEVQGTKRRGQPPACGMCEVWKRGKYVLCMFFISSGPSACQITAGQEFLKTLKFLLSDPSSLTQLSSIYLPQCDTDGAWRQVQCSGPPEQAFEWYERWITENNEGKTLPIANLLNILVEYKNASSKERLVFNHYKRKETFVFDLLTCFISLCMNSARMIWELTPYCFYLLLIKCSLPDTAAKHHVDKQRRCIPFSRLGLRTPFYFNMHTYVFPLVGQTSCQRSRANALISSWRQSGSKLDASATDLFVPYCLETGEYAMLQRSYTNAWCVDPESGEVFQRGSEDSDGPSFCNMLELKTSLREVGKGYIPKCEEAKGVFSPVQCTQDEESCWCVFDNGEEVPGTRVSRGRPSCESPQCAVPFGTSSILNGAVFCDNVSGQTLGVQQCRLVCRQGYNSAASNTLFQCDVQKHLWISAAPLYHACQKLQLFQTVQAQTHFQLLLPPQKTCSSDYSGLLQAFQIFILDELKGSPSYVLLLILFPLENALVGEKLIGAFIKEIEDGRFLLYLDSKQFLADSFIDFPQDEEFDLSPRVQLGCRSGFRRISSPGKIVPNAQGCVVCPPGTNFQNGECIPCPLGYYQHQTGQLSCIKCPVGKTTNSYGAFSADDCITYCKGNEQGLQCDEDGQYRPSQQDPDTKKSFCVDDFGAALDWTETDDLLTDYECLVLRKFERVPASTFVYGSDKVQILRSQSFGRDLFLLCFSDCDKEEACSFAAVTPAGADISCDLYSAAEVNFNCTTSGLVQGALGNPAATSISRLSCLLYIRNPEGDAVTVYLKKAQEFNSSGLKTFERTSFQNVLSGVYRSMTLSAAGTSLTDAQLFCRQICSRDSCCDGFILSQIALDGGTILCSLMTSPDVLICNANGWSPTQTSVINEICRGLRYDEGEKIFSFTLGGQVFSGNVLHGGVEASYFRNCDSFFYCLLVCCCCLFTWLVGFGGPNTPAVLCCSVQFSKEASPTQTSLTIVELNPTVENEFCQMADLRNTADTYFVCTLYPEAQICDGNIEQILENCRTVLPWQPQALYRKIGKLWILNFVFNFLKILFGRGNSSSSLLIPCISLAGGKIMCLTLNSLGIQTCAEESSAWQISNCSLPDTEVRIHPFGLYQKPADLTNTVPNLCPPVSLPFRPEKYLDTWQSLNVSSVLVDSTISNFEAVHVSREISNDFATAQDYCLSACSRNQMCAVVTLEIQASAIRCLFYPDTQICSHGLEGHSCQVLLKEPATYIYRRQGESCKVMNGGTKRSSNWKQVSFSYTSFHCNFLGFHRSTCWQPGDRETPSYSVSEDCLYLNVFVPVKNMSVLLFFHNGGSGNAEAGKMIIDGSYLAAISNTIVVTANYRVGVFGFLSVGSSEASGNAGLLDQLAALKWVQQNVGSFGGDPSMVSVGADRGGADIASIHLLAETINMGLFRRVLLMGGSAFSPASIITKRRAQAQAAVLADDVGCPSSTSEEIVACLRQLPAHVLNDAQTKLLAISGPFQYWGPVVDEVYLQEPLAKALQRPQLQKVDLLIGSAQQDGLISRAKAIKKFEESQGRTSSKTAFYQALQNSLGGEDSNLFIEDAATWYYSLEHSTDDYSSFSRALENDVPPASWYHQPESSLELLLDVQYAFGLPFYPKYEEQFTLEEKSLSLQIMQYISNFVNSGNPNYPHSFSRKMSRLLPPWPMFLPNDDGDNYKEFTISMPTLKGLKKADCSFWSDYIRRLKASTGEPSVS
uniref:Thyroglobulin n=1 Tax=Pavo cristatus TaxID=9049 RepID=A0A8C9G4S1_PAVCR